MKQRLLLCLLFCVLSCPFSYAETQVPPGFIENKGQIADDRHQVITGVQFKVEQPGLNAYFKPDGIIYHLYRTEKKTTADYSQADWDNYNHGNYAAIGEKVYFFRIDFELIGANINAQSVTKDEHALQRNYYLGHCPGGITGVREFGEITYLDVYPGIDLRYYYLNNQLKYEFIVHPGADPGLIRFRYNGSTQTGVKEGELIVDNVFAPLKEAVPYTFCQETGKEVNNSFKVENNEVSFAVTTYDPASTLVIDPTITWATFFNNYYSSDFHCNSAFDANGKIYSAFATYGTTWPVINAGGGQYYDATRDGITDLIILGLNANYSAQWITYYGGNDGDYLCGAGGDYGKTIGVDQNNNVYVAGYTTYAASPVFPTQASGVGGSFYQDQSRVFGGDNPFLLKFNSNGVRQWATIYNHEQANTNSAGMKINGICVKGTKVYFTGQTYRFNSNDIPLRNLAGAYYQPAFLGNQDPFIGRFNSDCVLEWSTYFNSGSAGVQAYKDGADLHVDDSGNLLFSGHISSGTAASGYLLNPGGGAYYQPTNTGFIDIYIAKFNSSMQPVWATYYGGTELDRVSQISSDASGNILVACRTVNSNNFPVYNPGGGAYYQGVKPSAGTNGDGAIMKFSPAGVRQWATYVGGTNNNNNSVTGIGADPSGNVYAVGYTNTSNFTTLNEAGSFYQGTSGGGTDLFYMKFNGSSVLQSSTYYGGTGSESCYGVKMATLSDACNFKQFNFFATTSTALTTVNPGAPAIYQTTSFTVNANACILFSTATGSLSTAATTMVSSPTVNCAPGFTTTLSLTGGSLGAGASWQWYTGGCGTTSAGSGTSINVSPATPTTYYARAEGSCNTTACVSLLVTPPTPVTAAVLSSTNVACFGGTSGTATVTPGGGTGIYTYTWAPSGGTSATASGLPAGTYTVTVTDGGPCSQTATITITQPALLTAAISSFTNIACNGGADGDATVSAGGGMPGYTYAWAPSGGTAATASGLASGTYTVIITDANTCSQTSTITLTEPVSLDASVTSSDDVNCFGGNDGSATATVTGGTPGYLYNWTPSGGTAATAPNLSAGTYMVTITDDHGCTQTAEINITEPAVLTCNITGIVPPSQGLGNGTLTVTASGGTPGYTYLWSPSGGTAATGTGFTNGGSYNVTVTDANGCTCSSSHTFENMGINDPADNLFTMYPNPGHDQFQVEVLGGYDEKDVYIRIYDISGKQLLARPVLAPIIYMDMSTYAPGVYLVNIVYGDKTFSRKWIKN